MGEGNPFWIALIFVETQCFASLHILTQKSRQLAPPAQQYERKKDASLSRHARDNHRDVVHEHVHGDGQEYDAEELA